MTFLEILGAFVLFFSIALLIGWTAGVVKVDFTWDKK